MNSTFNFLNCKVDRCALKIKQSVDTVVLNVDSKLPWSINLTLRPPMFFESNKVYLGGVDVVLLLQTPEAKTLGDSNEFIAKLELGIIGAFVTENRFDEKVEQNLVRSQIPAILFPYLRAAATSVAASAGFGPVIIPLINIQKWAEEKLQDVQVVIKP